ncbi:hypothetical protein BDZ45DRAFT_739814 [Acephala macrosclerotiorum]|nr:hypothetical protein BDZ45DRAFT_739814 [Acephala macrosclerotiorum]
MAANNRAVPYEEPPPYLEAPDFVHQNKRSSFAESLPEYTAKSEIATKLPPKQPFLRRKRVWICGGILVLIAVLAGTLGGLLGHKHSNSSHFYNGNGTFFIDKSEFVALAAAECDPITFVIYQKNETENTTIYLRGEKKRGTWDGSSSPVLNETALNLSPANSPTVNTNITAVCWWGTNSDSVNLQIYYISPALPGSTQNRVMEALVSFGDPTNALYPQVMSDIVTTQVATVSDVPSIAAVLLPPNNIRLYYLDTVEVGKDLAIIYEVNRKAAATGWSNPIPIWYDYAYSSHSPLTVSAVNATSAAAEIHLLYMNANNTLDRAIWTETGWNAQPILGSSNQSVSNILGMSSIIESTNPTILRLFYLQQRGPHVYDMSISPVYNSTSQNGLYTDNGVINAPSYNAFPIVTINPALISATSSGSGSASDMAQVFFVRGTYRWTQSGVDTAILNATVPVNGTGWSVSTLGQDPNSPPDSTMEMPT